MLPIRFAQNLASHYATIQRAAPALHLRLTATDAAKSGHIVQYKPIEPMPADFKEHPDRDLVNFPHYVTPMFSPKTRLGFIPDSWFDFFYKKTGVSGPYFFYGGLLCFLMQKEIFVMDHNFNLLWVIIVCSAYVTKKFGPQIASYLDKEVDIEADKEQQYRMDSVKNALQGIKEEEVMQKQATIVPAMIAETRKENVALQLESAYRERLKEAHDAVSRRVNFLAATEDTKTRFKAKHMVDWIVGQVHKSISPSQEQAVLNQCVQDLKRLAKTA